MIHRSGRQLLLGGFVSLLLTLVFQSSVAPPAWAYPRQPKEIVGDYDGDPGDGVLSPDRGIEYGGSLIFSSKSLTGLRPFGDQPAVFTSDPTLPQWRQIGACRIWFLPPVPLLGGGFGPMVDLMAFSDGGRWLP